MVAALVVTVLALGFVPGAGSERATSVDPPPCDGVVVVVDTAALPAAPDSPDGGFVACAPSDASSTEPSDGLEVLGEAGIEVEGTAQWGAAFVCRVDGRPAASEEIIVPGGGVVTEACDRTPSTDASWSLWTAEPGGAWTYAQTGVGDLELETGAALGLAFSVGPDAPAPPAVSASDALEGTVAAGWTWRSAAGVAPTGTSTSSTTKQTTARSTSDAVLTVVAVALVVALGAASVVLARRRR